MAPITVGLGPGFVAGIDVDVVVETMRGQDLGKLYFEGSVAPNTGIPSQVMGFSKERVIYSPVDGYIKHVKNIGDVVSREDVVFTIGETDVKSQIDGVVRGLIPEGIFVRKNLKCADVDPRPVDEVNCCEISDKARAIGAGVLSLLSMGWKYHSQNKPNSVATF